MLIRGPLPKRHGHYGTKTCHPRHHYLRLAEVKHLKALLTQVNLYSDYTLLFSFELEIYMKHNFTGRLILLRYAKQILQTKLSKVQTLMV